MNTIDRDHLAATLDEEPPEDEIGRWYEQKREAAARLSRELDEELVKMPRNQERIHQLRFALECARNTGD